MDRDAYQKSLGGRLRAARHRAGFTTVSAIAAQIGRAESTVHNWEKGESACPVEGLVQLAEAYGVSIEFLATPIEQPTIVDTGIVQSMLRSQSLADECWRYADGFWMQLRPETRVMKMRDLVELASKVARHRDDLQP